MAGELRFSSNELKITQNLAQETAGNPIQYENRVSNPVYSLLSDNGMCPAFHVCRRYQGYEILGRRFTSRNCHDRILESYRRLAQSEIYIFIISFFILIVMKVAHSLEVLPCMGFT